MSHAAEKTDLTPSRFVGGEILARYSRMALAVAVVALGLAVWLGWKDPAYFARQYLMNFVFVLSLALGGLLFCLIQQLTRSGWSAVVRRPAEALAANLQWIWILFLPFVGIWLWGRAHDGHGLSLASIWPWADLASMGEHDPAEAHIIAAKSGYLNDRFFFIRAAIYFIVWGSLARVFFRGSVAQDTASPEECVRITARLSRTAAAGIILFGLTTTFAAFDWIMSLSPAWFSTMFGVYFFAATCTGGYSLITLIVLKLRHLGINRAVVSEEHLQDLGKMIFAFGVVFWAYIAFSQYMLIWYGNIPEETTWFLARQVGGWGTVSIALLFGHFIIPFVFLISRWIKRWTFTLAVGCVWMLAFHWIDMYWLIMPVIPADVGSYATYNEFASAYADTASRIGNPVNFLLLLGLMGLLASSTMRRLSTKSVVCVHDPRINESLSFQNI
ncbi:MAG: quinol:cytochrome C oxidoreductase [Phycisphaerales bacterium]|nr:quinol:cytochrome C oxidoreductase [Phycisphaerales bacterium]